PKSFALSFDRNLANRIRRRSDGERRLARPLLRQLLPWRRSNRRRRDRRRNATSLCCEKSHRRHIFASRTISFSTVGAPQLPDERRRDLFPAIERNRGKR